LCLHFPDLCDRVLTAQRQQGIAHPDAPCFETAKSDTGLQTAGVLSPPTPNRQRRSEKLAASSFDLFQEAGLERSSFWIFEAGIELDENKSTREIFTNREAISGQNDKARMFEFYHSRLSQLTHAGRPLG